MVTVELTAFEAMMVQQALGERILKLNTKPHAAHPFEASVTGSGLAATNSALRKVLDALYPDPEPVSLSFELV